MEYAKQLLQERLDILNCGYKSYIKLPNVNQNSIAAIENRSKVKSIEDAILLLSDAPSIQQLEKERLEWSFQNFPDATSFSSLLKLNGEISEVVKELKQLEKFPEQEGLSKLSMEYADCLMCLFDSAGRAGLSVDDIIESFSEKLEINKNRKWIKNSDNTYSHVKI